MLINALDHPDSITVSSTSSITRFCWATRGRTGGSDTIGHGSGLEVIDLPTDEICVLAGQGVETVDIVVELECDEFTN